MVIVSEIIICNISASCKPVPDEIGGVEDTQRTSQKHDCLEELGCLVLLHRHSVAYVRKYPTDGSKLFRNPIHTLDGNGKIRTGQRGGIPPKGMGTASVGLGSGKSPVRSCVWGLGYPIGEVTSRVKNPIRLGVREMWLEVSDWWLAVCTLRRQSHHQPLSRRTDKGNLAPIREKQVQGRAPFRNQRD